MIFNKTSKQEDVLEEPIFSQGGVVQFYRTSQIRGICEFNVLNLEIPKYVHPNFQSLIPSLWGVDLHKDTYQGSEFNRFGIPVTLMISSDQCPQSYAL